MAEYALIIGGIAIVVIAGILFLGAGDPRTCSRRRAARSRPSRPRSSRHGRAGGGPPGLRAPDGRRLVRSRRASTILRTWPVRADDGRCRPEHEIRSCGIMWRTITGGGLAVRRMRSEARGRRGDDRVCAHRARLPARSSPGCSASGGSSSTGSRRTTWRARPRAGPSSTATRTRPVPRRCTPRHRRLSVAPAARAVERDGRVRERHRRLHRLPDRGHQPSAVEPVIPSVCRIQKPVHVRPAPRHRSDHDPRLVDDAHRAASQRRHRRRYTRGLTAAAARTSGRAHEPAQMRDERGGDPRARGAS